MYYLICFVLPMMIGVVGALQAGPISVSILQLSQLGGLKRSVPVIIGSIFPECLIIGTIMIGVRNLVSEPTFFKLAAFLMTVILVGFGIFYLFFKRVIPSYVESPSRLETMSSSFVSTLLNPVHLVFWMGSLVLLAFSNLIGTNLYSILTVTLGGATGTLLVNIMVARIGATVHKKKLVSLNILSIKLHGLLVLCILGPVLVWMVNDVFNN